MKRCPQCEFIYEDDQNLCDMDGSQLTLDSRLLPKLQALNETSSSSATKRNWKGHTVPLFASVSLLFTLFSVYYFSVHPGRVNSHPTLNISTQSVPPSTGETASELSAPVVTETVQPIAVADQPEVSVPAEKSRDVESNERNANDAGKKQQKHQAGRAANESQPQPVRNTTVGPRRPAPEEKKDSRVGSMLKKTEQFLKRPFKF